MTIRAKRYQNAAALLIFCTDPFEPAEPAEPAEPVEPTEPAELLSNAIKGQHAHGLTLKFESRDEWLGIRDWVCVQRDSSHLSRPLEKGRAKGAG